MGRHSSLAGTEPRPRGSLRRLFLQPCRLLWALWTLGFYLTGDKLTERVGLVETLSWPTLYLLMSKLMNNDGTHRSGVNFRPVFAALPGIRIHPEKHLTASCFSPAAIPGLAQQGVYFFRWVRLHDTVPLRKEPDTFAQAWHRGPYPHPRALEPQGSPGEGLRDRVGKVQLCLLWHKFNQRGRNPTNIQLFVIVLRVTIKVSFFLSDIGTQFKSNGSR